MIKIIDIDALFDGYISDYVYKNIGKVKPEEIENQMPVLYQEFGDKTLKELDGKTPNEFYKRYSAEELIECLKGHLEKDVAISDFLCEAIRDNGQSEALLFNELWKENDDQFILYCMNILHDKDSKMGLVRYLEFIVSDYSDSIRELATEILRDNASDVLEEVLQEYNQVSGVKKECLTEILSRSKIDDRVLGILTEQLLIHPDNYPLYANYLASYGDDRALPVLYQLAENPKIDYRDYEEIRFAIETLGGELKEKRDFSRDSLYKKIVGVSSDKTH